MALLSPPRRSTLDDYLKRAEDEPGRLEYHRGRSVARADEPTADHATIVANVVRGLKRRAAGRPWRVYGGTVRLRAAPSDSHWFPDVMLVDGPPAFDTPDRRTTISNPHTIIEVASDASVAADLSDRLYSYIAAGTLAEYAVVFHDRAAVRHHFRTARGGGWALAESAGGLTAGSLALRSLNVTIPLAEVYANVRLP